MNTIKNKSTGDVPPSSTPSSNGISNKPGKIGGDNRNPKMLEAAQSFEGQFIRQMIAEMRKTIPKDELTGESMADDIFKGQLDDQYADMWVGQGGIGLADMIYDQLYQKYGPPPALSPKGRGEFIALPRNTSVPGREPASEDRAKVAVVKASDGAAAAAPRMSSSIGTRPKDILSETDKRLFLLKMDSGRFSMKSKEPLKEAVGLRSPFSGVVLQSASLEDGRQMLVVRHDLGLVTRFVHNGYNHVKNNMRVDAGEIIADLPTSKNGEVANVVFELRQGGKPE